MNSVQALKETQSADHNQWPGRVLSSSTNGHLTEGSLHPLCRLFNAGTDFLVFFWLFIL